MAGGKDAATATAAATATTTAAPVIDPREAAKEKKYKSVIELQKALAMLQIRARNLSSPDDPMLQMQVQAVVFVSMGPDTVYLSIDRLLFWCLSVVRAIHQMDQLRRMAELQFEMDLMAERKEVRVAKRKACVSKSTSVNTRHHKLDSVCATVSDGRYEDDHRRANGGLQSRR